MIAVTKELLEKYLRGQRYDAYDKTVYMAQHLDFHFNGMDRGDKKNKPEANQIFKNLIFERRPSESQSIMEYRTKIFLSHTKAPCSKVLNSLNKIVKAPDWHIDYTKSKDIPKITEEENLENYCEKNYPFFKSIENWVYSIGLKQILEDPNALLVVIPIEYDLQSTADLYRPFAYFIKSENVYDYVENQFAVFRTDKTSEYTENNKTYKDYVIAIVTDTEIWEATKTSINGTYNLELKLTHNIGKLPIIRTGGLHKEIIDNTPIYESFVSPILPGLDAAAREISDLDAEVVQHIFSTMWYYSTQDCKSCTGVGVISKAGVQSICATCGGSGAVAKSPYKDFIVKPDALGEKASPTPPAGYIQKDTAIVKIQDERIKSHIHSALSAINMEFLTETPLSQSGDAKEVDRDELNNFVYRIAYHLVENIMKPIYFFIGEYRYSLLVENPNDRKEMQPNIIVPERFEILSETYLQQQVTQAIASKQSPIIINSLEIEYVSKKFANYPEIRDKIITIKTLDPLGTLTVQEKSDALLAGIVTKEDAMLSTYITSFVEKAINEDEGFLEKSYDEKLAVLTEYAQEKASASDAAQKLKDKAQAAINPPVQIPVKAA